MIAKNRKGRTGAIPIIFAKEYCYFYEDREKIAKEIQIFELMAKASQTKSLIKFSHYCHKIKKIDYDFWYNNIYQKSDSQPIFIMGGIK